MRSKLEVQEKALARLVKLGEAAYHVTLPEERNKKGYLVTEARRLYKVCQECQYGLRKEPREESIVKRCCASCMHKDYIDMKEDGKTTVRQGVRICRLHGNREVTQSGICDEYKMKESYERL